MTKGRLVFVILGYPALQLSSKALLISLQPLAETFAGRRLSCIISTKMTWRPVLLLIVIYIRSEVSCLRYVAHIASISETGAEWDEQVLSGHVPYSYLLRDAQVVIEVHKGVKPRRPSTPFVTNQLWTFINVCWNDEPTSRPDITEVSKTIQDFLHGNRRHTLLGWFAFLWTTCLRGLEWTRTSWTVNELCITSIPQTSA